MDNIYWWYPHKIKEDTLIFQFVNEEWEISEEEFEQSDIVDDVHEIQELVDNFYSKYAPKNSSMDSLN